MYQVLRNYLSNGSYTRGDAEFRIARLAAGGHITEDEERELRAVADVHAMKDGAPTLAERVAALEAAVFGAKAQDTSDKPEEETGDGGDESLAEARTHGED